MTDFAEAAESLFRAAITDWWLIDSRWLTINGLNVIPLLFNTNGQRDSQFNNLLNATGIELSKATFLRRIEEIMGEKNLFWIGNEFTPAQLFHEFGWGDFCIARMQKDFMLTYNHDDMLLLALSKKRARNVLNILTSEKNLQFPLYAPSVKALSNVMRDIITKYRELLLVI